MKPTPFPSAGRKGGKFKIKHGKKGMIGMSSDMELTDSQKQFWQQEGHNGGKMSLAIIHPDGRIEMDYPSEIIRRFISYQKTEMEEKVKDNTKRICEELGVNPLRFI
jgi:hypothetical protein